VLQNLLFYQRVHAFKKGMFGPNAPSSMSLVLEPVNSACCLECGVRSLVEFLITRVRVRVLLQLPMRDQDGRLASAVRLVSKPTLRLILAGFAHRVRVRCSLWAVGSGLPARSDPHLQVRIFHTPSRPLPFSCAACVEASVNV
jgi:hypothetical protein